MSHFTKRTRSAAQACGTILFGFVFAGLVNAADAPLMGVLDRFTAPDVPAMGPAETAVNPRKPSTRPVGTGLPGNGLAQHAMLYVGEGYNRMFLVNGGKVIWKYDTGQGNEYDDVWMLSNGNILFTRMQYIAEITPKKEV